MIRWLLVIGLVPLAAQDWKAVEAETIKHFQALIRFDTSDPPGREQEAADYVKQVLEAEGIATKTFTVAKGRPNIVARLKGSGKKRPILIIGHTDVVAVDAKKWKHPAFGAVREGGYVYGRGTIDDKDNVVGSLMTMLLLKRLNVPLDRDVIFLAESGEEGHTRVGIQYMVGAHYSEIDAEYCLGEGWGAVREGGKLRYVAIATTEKTPYRAQLIARGPAGHGSKPLTTNALLRLSRAVTKVSEYRPPLRLNDTTRAYFEKIATISTPEEAARFNGLLDAARTESIQVWMQVNDPANYALLRTTLSPTILQAGYRSNVIPSEAQATLDVRLAPGDNGPAFFEELRKVINDPTVEVTRLVQDIRPASPPSALDNEAYRAIEAASRKVYPGVPAIPTMMTGATDMANLRAKGQACYGIGPALDVEDGPLGFGAHSDQERVLESALHDYVRFQYEIVHSLAKAQ
jgi:acetylornithine deacetylase/succinyl-diaminopimelate desuccinylase-like protein